MTLVAVTVSNLGKWYVVNENRYRPPLSDALIQMIDASFRRPATKRQPAHALPASIWALRNVSFEVKSGSVSGIIGRNGSGKSTLLRILARITTPTEGRATMHGRVGALLEVGTGFHPDFSGRENIMLIGTMMGMTPKEVRKYEDEIIEFSEIHDFVDTPVKHYSTGMFMRLAFSVAAHLESEIMLVDEVLAVGDDAFQQKCKAKIRTAALAGRTVLFTSHDMNSILGICQSCLLLDRGQSVHQGNVEECVRRYTELCGVTDMAQQVISQ